MTSPETELKKGAKTDLSNWRPISLLFSDYKILSKILANRLKTTLKNVINKDQTGGIPGRHITDNLTTIRNIINNTNKKEAKAIISVDLEKAYDRVDRQILYEAMSKLGYPNKFIQSIKTLMENSIAKIIVNGKIGKEIKMERGIKQGCPLASFLYIIYIESLQLELQKNLITSRIGQEKIQTEGFIDDINIFVSDEEDQRRRTRNGGGQSKSHLGTRQNHEQAGMQTSGQPTA